MAVSIPLAVTNLLAARYPTLVLNPTWLEGCVTYLRQEHADRPLTDAQLAKLVRTQLLSADLSDAAQAAVLDETVGASRATIGEGPRKAVLLQIVSMIDVGISAATQLEVAEARKAARSTLGGAELLQSVPAEEEEEDHMADFNANEERAGKNNLVFPRKMLRLELSDGKSGFNVLAFEHDRVKALDMNSTLMGCKVLLKGAKVRRGQIYLNDKCCIVEGGEVQHMQEQAETILINLLRAKLGKPPIEETPTTGNRASQTLTPPKATSSAKSERKGASVKRSPSCITVNPSPKRTRVSTFTKAEVRLDEEFGLLSEDELERIKADYMAECSQIKQNDGDDDDDGIQYLGGLGGNTFQDAIAIKSSLEP